MSTNNLDLLPVEELKRQSDRHPKPLQHLFQYGTAGFRMNATLLDSVVFRVGVLAALRSKRLEGKTVGVMITASHNPPQDNGVKLVDPRGEMLEAIWETYATELANAHSTGEFIARLKNLIDRLKIDLSHPSHVLYGRDTRTSGPDLVAALEDGITAMGGVCRDEGVTTTPILHYLVRCKNTKGTKEHYGEDNEDAYFEKMSKAFNKLIEKKPSPPPLVVDCANGVGYNALVRIESLITWLQFIPQSYDLATPGALNSFVGADYIKTNQKLPQSLTPHMKPGQRGCSFDGDADRLIYFHIDDRGVFRLLDGDKIAALVSVWICDLVLRAGLFEAIKVGVVQTAYANGNSTKYLEGRLPVECVPTGVKHLHHAAQSFGIGIYFEANGHGTVLFSPATLELLASHEPANPTQLTALEHLTAVKDMVNQTVGDALSDLLLVEACLAHKSYTAWEWDSLYNDLPNRLVKVSVPDRGEFTTEDAERKLVTPWGLQKKIEEIFLKYPGGRAFVRPSGTEDVVRVYAEADNQTQADELAFKVAGLVYDEAGGDPMKRPREFI